MDVSTSVLPQQDFPGQVSDLRRRVRKVVWMPATVASHNGSGHGVVTNISESGCQLQLVTSFRPSHHLTLTINPQDGHTALLITLAGNRWIKQESVGVEFLSLSKKDKAKLQKLCSGSRTPLA
jgi:PilZ domain-containing protein